MLSDHLIVETITAFAPGSSPIAGSRIRAPTSRSSSKLSRRTRASASHPKGRTCAPCPPNFLLMLRVLGVSARGVAPQSPFESEGLRPLRGLSRAPFQSEGLRSLRWPLAASSCEVSLETEGLRTLRWPLAAPLEAKGLRTLRCLSGRTSGATTIVVARL